MQRWYMPDLQRYPWNLFPIKDEANTVVFLTRKCLFLEYPHCFFQASNAQLSLSQRNHKFKNKQFKKQKHWYLIFTWSDKAFRGTSPYIAKKTLNGLLTYFVLPDPCHQTFSVALCNLFNKKQCWRYLKIIKF